MKKFMTPEYTLREKLRKIEALFAGAATPGEKLLRALLRNVSVSASAKHQARKSLSS
jgi:hypothetical protein